MSSWTNVNEDSKIKMSDSLMSTETIPLFGSITKQVMLAPGHLTAAAKVRLVQGAVVATKMIFSSNWLQYSEQVQTKQ